MKVLQSKAKWLQDRSKVSKAHLRIIPPNGKKWEEYFVSDTHYGQKDVLEQGKVPCYYHVHSEDDFVYIIYYFFYPFNGSMGVSHQGVMEAHEADWEHLTVTLRWNSDKTRLLPISGAGGGHGGLGSVINAACDPNDLKPLKVYSALHSHATYAAPGEYELKSLRGKAIPDFAKGPLGLKDLTKDGGLVWKTSENLVKADAQFWFDDYEGRWGTIKETKPKLPSKIPGIVRNKIEKALEGQVKGRSKGPFGPKGKGQESKFYNPAGTLWENSLKDTGNGVTSVHISNDGKSIYAALRGFVLRLDPLTGKELERKEFKGRGDNEVRMDSDETHLYAGIDGHVFALDPLSLEIKWDNSLKGTGHGITSVHARPDVGAVYAACNGHVRRLWNKNGQLTGSNDLPGSGDHEVRLESDAKALYVGTNGYVFALNLSTPNSRKTDTLAQKWKSNLKGTGEHVTSMHVRGSSVYATCGGKLLRLKSSNGHEQARKDLDGNHEIRMDSDGTHLYAGTNGIAYALDPASLQIKWKNSLKGTGHGITSVHARPDVGAVYAACNGHVLRLWNKNGQLTNRNDLKGTGNHEVRIANRSSVGLFFGTNGRVVHETFGDLRSWK
ncbi:PQQ-binding-like beta-propeller repeat protein [bacterium]|nr:PQQ-binding-like beta-propeller repeat protein [bacterium]